MNRRHFFKTVSASGVAVITPGIWVKKMPSDKMKRVGLTTVVFRNRFKSTCPKNLALRNELTLDIIPEFFTDRFGVHNIELWSNHIEDKSPAFLNDLSKKFKKHKCRLIDIQAEGTHDISDPVEENRLKGITEAKEWIDVCASLKSDSVRIRSMRKSYEKSVESLRVINTYAKKKGVNVLIENHLDLFSDTRNHVKIIHDIPDRNIGLLADFGNYANDVDRYLALQTIAPFTKLVSAKTKDFNSNLEHISYDYGKCLDLFEGANYQGVYSAEQWGTANPDYDYEKITDRMIAEIKEHVRG